MNYTGLGERGPRVSTVGFGAWAIGGVNWGPTDDAESKRALRAALREGVTLIDTADVYGYGHSERLICEVLDSWNESRVVVATKAGNDFYNAGPEDDTGYGPIRLNGSRDYLLFAVDRSLERLQVEALDLLQLHSLKTEDLSSEEPWEALRLLKEEGKVRHAGWSVTSYRETEQAPFLDRYHELIDVIQVRYNLLERSAEEALFPKAIEYGIGVIVRIPLLFGLLTGKFDRTTRFTEEDHRSFNLAPEQLRLYLEKLEQWEALFEELDDQSMAQVSLRFCLTHPACHTVIPGAKTAQQVRENVAVSDLGPLPKELAESFGLESK